MADSAKFYPEPQKMPLKMKPPATKQKPDIVRGTGHGDERKMKAG